MTSRLARVVATIVVVIGMFAVAPAERVSAECRTSPITGRTECWLTSSPRAARRTAIGDGSTSSFVWVQLSFSADSEFQVRSGYCTRTVVDGLTTTFEFGNNYAVWLENAATGVRVTSPRSVCLFPEDPNPTPPPPPPSPAEFVEAARTVLSVQTSLSPRTEIGGLTGLDTWLWCEDPGDLQVGVALRGWTATATMQDVQHAWAIGGTASAVFNSASCGSEGSPAASWMPEMKGSYSVTLTSTWAGDWTLAYNGLPAGTFPLGPFDFAAPTVPYPVSEYRGRLTSPGGEGR